MPYVQSDEVRKIRGQLDHPVIDGDGHLIEYSPLVRDFLVEIAGEEIAKAFDQLQNGSRLARQVPLEAKRGLGMTRFACFWVEGGEIVAPIDVMRFDETLYRAFGENLIGLTRERDLILDPGTYGARSTDSARVPGALIEDFHFNL